MDLVHKEHERIWKRLKSNKTLKDVQATIDLLQEARDTVAAGMLLHWSIDLPLERSTFYMTGG